MACILFIKTVVNYLIASTKAICAVLQIRYYKDSRRAIFVKGGLPALVVNPSTRVCTGSYSYMF
jgi:hypothetical protein